MRFSLLRMWQLTGIIPILEAEPEITSQLPVRPKEKNEWYVGGITDENSREALIDFQLSAERQEISGCYLCRREKSRLADKSEKEYVIETRTVSHKTKLRQKWPQWWGSHQYKGIIGRRLFQENKGSSLIELSA